MADKKQRKVGRYVALGTVLATVAVWGSVGLLGAAPSSITTCTKTSNNKTKVIATSGVAKCTAKGKGVAQTWAPQSQLTAANNAAANFMGQTLTLCGAIASDSNIHAAIYREQPGAADGQPDLHPAAAAVIERAGRRLARICNNGSPH